MLLILSIAFAPFAIGAEDKPVGEAAVLASTDKDKEDLKEELLISEDTSIRAALEELYENYEVIDKSLRELRLDLGDLESGAVVTSFTVSVRKDKRFRLVSLEVRDNGNPLWNHIYTPFENQAMVGGGRHQFYKGTINKGTHRLELKYQYQLPGSGEYLVGEKEWKMSAGDEPVFLELKFTKEAEGIIAKPRKLHIFEDKYLDEPSDEEALK